MAFAAYLSIVAERQGQIRGSVTQKGREGKSLVLAVQHEIVAPRDPQSGLPTGKRMHKPLIVTKEFDRASPPLYTVLCTNENLVEVRIEFWTWSPTGQEKQHYTVQLTNANISGITAKLPNIRNAKLVRLSEYEEVALTYEKITWTWTEGGITAGDDWATPR
jgi:type VI secretion system secreted protein Hcp